MFEEMRTALEAYQQKWQALLEARADSTHFAALKPMSMGWKMADEASHDAAYRELRGLCDQMHSIHKNGRWLVVMHLRDKRLPWDISVINLMQRRPGSNDRPGLDNVSFYDPEYLGLDAVLAVEPQLKWTKESNGQHSSWTSLWFADTEAKLRPESVLDVCLREFKEIRDRQMQEIR